MTSTPDELTWTPRPLGYHDLAERALRALEDTEADTPAPVAIAHGFTAVTYAVLALNDTAQGHSIDLTNVLADISAAAVDTAANTGLAVDVMVAPAWWRRLAWPLRRGLRDIGTQEQ